MSLSMYALLASLGEHLRIEALLFFGRLSQRGVYDNPDRVRRRDPTGVRPRYDLGGEWPNMGDFRFSTVVGEASLA